MLVLPILDAMLLVLGFNSKTYQWRKFKTAICKHSVRYSATISTDLVSYFSYLHWLVDHMMTCNSYQPNEGYSIQK